MRSKKQLVFLTASLCEAKRWLPKRNNTVVLFANWYHVEVLIGNMGENKRWTKT